MAAVYEATGRQAWVALPLRVGERLLGSLLAAWTEPHTFDADEIGLLSAFAAQCGQALARLGVRELEKQAAAAAGQMSEALQRSLLTDPPQSDHLEIVVRYRPAAAQVQVGGDWYDAFVNSGGATCLVVGDVTGHDREAAAVMGQIRNLLRGLAHTLGDPPGLVLSAVDKAMRDLQVGALATAVLAIVEQTTEQRDAGIRTLRWTSAGHLPPLLLEPDGTSRLLTTDPDLLLGLDATAERSDHQVELQPGSTVVLYTDGLVERRGTSIDEGLDWLLTATADRHDLSPDQLSDILLDAVRDSAEDDIALLVVRAHPEDRPRL
jgi:serine phosphatase RsbU (regulator of sigma subunit)